METNTETIPKKVQEELLEIRATGLINMFSAKSVQFYANERDCYAAVCWIEDNPLLYAKWVLGKVEVEDG